MKEDYRIIIIDSGYGNTQAVSNMLLSIGWDSVITRDKKIIKEATHLILPGVGSFDAAMESLSPIVNVIQELVLERGVNILGICLGMQLLGTSSEEGRGNGLNLIEGEIIKLPFNENYKVPHLNWEYIKYNHKEPIFDQFKSSPKFYFAHSYHFIPQDNDTIVASFAYPDDIIAIVKKENICGVQFHPEKSHRYGQIFFKKYFELKK